MKQKLNSAFALILLTSPWNDNISFFSKGGKQTLSLHIFIFCIIFLRKKLNMKRISKNSRIDRWPFWKGLSYHVNNSELTIN